MHCQNGGTCYHSNYKGRFTCACSGRFSGELCEKAEARVYRFTNLEQFGRYGPTSTVGYAGKKLEGQVQLKQGKQEWKVPTTGQYYISIAGASGGDASSSSPFGKKGGLGARVYGFITLNAGNVLTIVVGQEGLAKKAGGGGGGSFVFFRDTNSIIAIAGGGGGGGGELTQKIGEDGLGQPSGGIRAGKAGFGGFVCMEMLSGTSPGGGAGFAEDGKCFKSLNCSDGMVCTEGGGSISSHFIGGLGDGNGGYGGGGAGGASFPGGGGGYSGGGVEAKSNLGQAGGGGSKKYNSSWQTESGVNIGHGSVNITLIG